MSYEHLSLKGFIDEMKETTYSRQPRRFCFVLGSGASFTSGIPTGRNLVDLWSKVMEERNPDGYNAFVVKNGITDGNKYQHYSQFYEERYRHHPIDGYNYLEKIMDSAKPSIGYIILAHILCHTIHNLVITTNFDHLTENAIHDYYHEMPKVAGHESLAKYISPDNGRATVVKIHRDLLFDPHNTSDAVDQLHKNWEKLLDKLFCYYHPVFIGYAGNDNSLMNYLNKSAASFQSHEFCTPYWLLFKSDPLEDRVRHFLDNASGYCIPHDGFDEVFVRLATVFNIDLPQKDAFITEAMSRYNDMTDSFDKLSEKIYSKPQDVADTLVQSSAVPVQPQDSDLDFAIKRLSNQSEPAGLFIQAMMLDMEHQFEEATRLKRQLIELEPANARYHDSLGTTLHKMKRYEEALAEKRKAIELEPDNARYHDSLSLTLHKMARYDEALAEKRTVVELEPTNAWYRDSLSTTLHEIGRYEEALAEDRKTVELEPDNALYHNSLGVTLHKMKHHEEALAEKRKAVELEPDNARYYDSLGITLQEMARYDEALAQAQKAIELDPSYARAYRTLAVALHSTGHQSEALAAIHKALSFDNSDSMLLELLEKIQNSNVTFNA